MNKENPITDDPLKNIMARMFKKSPFAEPVLTLEVIDGPYKGVTFMYTKFDYKNEVTSNGMVPVQFETEVLQAPAGFQKDEAFDLFTTEIVLGWLHYVHVNNLSPLIRVKTTGVH